MRKKSTPTTVPLSTTLRSKPFNIDGKLVASTHAVAAAEGSVYLNAGAHTIGYQAENANGNAGSWKTITVGTRSVSPTRIFLPRVGR